MWSKLQIFFFILKLASAGFRKFSNKIQRALGESKRERERERERQTKRKREGEREREREKKRERERGSEIHLGCQLAS